MSEAQNQQVLRLAAAANGAALWRNNSGACLDDRGRMIRYGLGNDSKKLNEVWKSSDLIGITPVTITPEMVGRVMGVFTACEVKADDWNGVRSDHEKAQASFLNTVIGLGGIGFFGAKSEHYSEAIRMFGCG